MLKYVKILVGKLSRCIFTLLKTKIKKVSRSFTESEIEMFNYFMNKIADNVSAMCSLGIKSTALSNY